jgi:hypothetical protein
MGPAKFFTRDIPQADRLEKVLQTVEAVIEGAATELQIAEAMVSPTDKHGIIGMRPRFWALLKIQIIMHR